MGKDELNSEGRKFKYIIISYTLFTFILAFMYSIYLGYDPMVMVFFLGFLYFVIVLSLFSEKQQISYD